MMVSARNAMVTLLTSMAMLGSCSAFVQDFNMTSVPAHCQPPPCCTNTVTHNVLFQFKDHLDESEILYVSYLLNPWSHVQLLTTRQAARRFFALKSECVNPETQCPYIISLKGGKDQSIEGLNVSIIHSSQLYRPKTNPLPGSSYSRLHC